MAHPYPPHWSAFNYVGRHRYALTFRTHARRAVFVRADVVDLVLTHILRAACEKHFVDIAHCFMPDHVHVVVQGEADDSDAKAFTKAAKQYSGYYYSQKHGAVSGRDTAMSG